MKAQKIFIALIVVILMCSMSVCLFACGNDNADRIIDNDGTKGNMESDDGEVESVVVTSQTFMSEQYNFSSVNNGNSAFKVIDSYKDDTYYYYCVDLGVVKNVPVTTPQIYEYRTSATYRQSYTYSTINSHSLETASSNVVSRLKYDFPIAGANFGVQGLEIGFQFNSDTTTTTNSTSTKESEEETISKTKTTEVTFDSSCQHGFYRICYARHYYIYAYIVKRISDGKYTWSYVPVAQEANRLVFEYSQDDFEESRGVDGFVFYETKIASLPIPTKTTKSAGAGNNKDVQTVSTYYIDTKALSCKLDNHYNYDKPDPNGDNKHYSHQFEFGKFVVKNVVGKNNSSKYSLAKGYAVDVTFRVNYDCNSLPVQDNMSSRYVNSDSKQSGFYKLPYDVGSRDVKKGMLVALITYQDGTPADRICLTNVFDKKYSGDEIEIAKGITKPCTIDIAICYELTMWAPGLVIPISDDYWMNWRINQVITIE